MNTPYFSRYRHAEFLQYLFDVTNLLNKQDLAALKLEEPKTALETAIQKIDKAFKQAQGSKITQDIIEMDERRDRAITGLRTLLEGYKYHYDEQLSNAAKALLDTIAIYGSNIQRLSYQEETAVINSLVKDWEDNEVYVNAAIDLKLWDWIKELKESNELFSQKYLDRVSDNAARTPADIPQLRTVAIDAYRTLINHITAHATLEDTQAYDILLNELDILAKNYNQTVDNRTSSATDPDTSNEVS
ncbi:DUF6261 family protein [Aquimarina sp. W85]|uniref:DUF6261 family protein n=1 Tax=Aquimarina rhodophyticola TaxID=3342246 RepID=UPI00366B5C3D